jgi:hypothetical protein
MYFDVLERPLGHAMSTNTFHVDCFSPEAFKPSPRRDCVVRQLLAEVTTSKGKPFFTPEELHQELDFAFEKLHKVGEYPYEFGGWRDEGVSAKMLIELCDACNLSCVLLHGNRCIQNRPRPGRPLVAAGVWGDHLFVYQRFHAPRLVERFCTPQQTHLMRFNPFDPADGDDVRVPFRRMLPFEGEILPGETLYATSVDESLLRGFSFTRILGKDGYSVMRYLVKIPGQPPCRIKLVPPNYQELIDALAAMGDPVEYAGQSAGCSLLKSSTPPSPRIARTSGPSARLNSWMSRGGGAPSAVLTSAAASRWTTRRRCERAGGTSPRTFRSCAPAAIAPKRRWRRSASRSFASSRAASRRRCT